MKKIMFTVFLVVISIFMFGCSDIVGNTIHEIDSNIVGYWEFNSSTYDPSDDLNGNNYYDKVQSFNEDGTFEYCNITDGPIHGTWYISNGMLHMTDSFGNSNIYNYTCSNDVLTIETTSFNKTTLFDLNQKQWTDSFTYYENGFTFTATINNNESVTVNVTYNGTNDYIKTHIEDCVGTISIKVKNGDHGITSLMNYNINGTSLTIDLNDGLDYNNVEFVKVVYFNGDVGIDNGLDIVKYHNNYWNL